ncbi:uncharacterized protein LOC119690005 isoform X5 [Teleopsis dalmanni]|uniref:uncharacterized protein LOC119690005 isoform X5 n=1 Tax=Teleopsis dalmanni TaxID=139649 RepID=UPI0018CEA446|nr:uncharacterized protein LOC119690005 isoform X5 [Teleopsis dalmanni]
MRKKMDVHVEQLFKEVSHGCDNIWCKRRFLESGMIEISAELHLRCEEPVLKIKNLLEIEVDFYYKILNKFGADIHQSELFASGYEYQAGITAETKFANIYYKRFLMKPTVSDKSKFNLTYYFLLGHVTVSITFYDKLNNEYPIVEYNIIHCVPIDYSEAQPSNEINESPPLPKYELDYDSSTERFVLYKPSTNQVLRHSLHNMLTGEDFLAPGDYVVPTDDEALYDEDMENPSVINSSDSVRQAGGGHDEDNGHGKDVINFSNPEPAPGDYVVPTDDEALYDEDMENPSVINSSDSVRQAGGGHEEDNGHGKDVINFSNPEPAPGDYVVPTDDEALYDEDMENPSVINSSDSVRQAGGGHDEDNGHGKDVINFSNPEPAPGDYVVPTDDEALYDEDLENPTVFDSSDSVRQDGGDHEEDNGHGKDVINFPNPEPAPGDYVVPTDDEALYDEDMENPSVINSSDSVRQAGGGHEEDNGHGKDVINFPNPEPAPGDYVVPTDDEALYDEDMENPSVINSSDSVRQAGGGHEEDNGHGKDVINFSNPEPAPGDYVVPTDDEALYDEDLENPTVFDSSDSVRQDGGDHEEDNGHGKDVINFPNPEPAPGDYVVPTDDEALYDEDMENPSVINSSDSVRQAGGGHEEDNGHGKDVINFSNPEPAPGDYVVPTDDEALYDEDMENPSVINSSDSVRQAGGGHDEDNGHGKDVINFSNPEPAPGDYVVPTDDEALYDEDLENPTVFDSSDSVRQDGGDHEEDNGHGKDVINFPNPEPAPGDYVVPTDDEALYDEDMENPSVINSSDSVRQAGGGHEEDNGHGKDVINFPNPEPAPGDYVVPTDDEALYDEDMENPSVINSSDSVRQAGGGHEEDNGHGKDVINFSNPEPDPPLPVMNDTSKCEIESVFYNEMKTKDTPLEENRGNNYDACMSDVLLSDEVEDDVKSVNNNAQKLQDQQMPCNINIEEDCDSV